MKYCWSTPFNVLGVLFLEEVSSAFWPSKKACWTHQFRHLGVDQQYPGDNRAPQKKHGMVTQDCGSCSGQRITRSSKTIEREAYAHSIEDHAGQLHVQPHIFAVSERRVVKGRPPRIDHGGSRSFGALMTIISLVLQNYENPYATTSW